MTGAVRCPQGHTSYSDSEFVEIQGTETQLWPSEHSGSRIRVIRVIRGRPLFSLRVRSDRKGPPRRRAEEQSQGRTGSVSNLQLQNSDQPASMTPETLPGIWQDPGNAAPKRGSILAPSPKRLPGDIHEPHKMRTI